VGGGESKREFGGQKYNKYNKINNNSENFRGGQDCCQRGFANKEHKQTRDQLPVLDIN